MTNKSTISNANGGSSAVGVDPDYLKIYQNIDINKNYLELILRQILPLQKRINYENRRENGGYRIFQVMHCEEADEVVVNKQAKYSINALSFLKLLQPKQPVNE